MYTEFFRLKRDPFSIAPDPRYLFMSEQHREALAHLLYGLKGGGGFVLLTGEIGAGKTTVCRCFLEQIPRKCNVAYIFNPKQTVEELMKSVCDEFRIPSRHDGPGAATVKDYVDALNEFLLRTHAVGQNNVLIIDEAQNLSADVLEQLRLLTNLETSHRKLLQIVLIGQPELRTLLAQPNMEQLSQRIIARYHLNALSRADTFRYIDHRLAVAGLRAEIPFSRSALERIYTLSRGVPRRINLLAGRALLGAYASRKAKVDRRIVEKAAREVFVGTGAESVARGGVGRRTAAIAAGAAAGVLLLAALALLDPGIRQRVFGHDKAKAAAATPPRAVIDTLPSSGSAPGSTPIDITAADLSTRLEPQQRDEARAWQALAAVWKLPLAQVEGDPCRSQQPVQCFRATTSLTQLRQLDRPGILTLYDQGEKPAYALLAGLNDQGATLQWGDAAWHVSVASLARVWRGEFATFWRAPPGYEGAAVEAGRGSSAAWVSDRLTQLTGTPATPKPPRESELKSMIVAFQTSQGLNPDGLAGPLTLMQINRATGVDEPRLGGKP